MRFVSFIGTALALIICLKAAWHAVWQMMLCDMMGRKIFKKILIPLIMFPMHRLDSDLTLLLYSDFADLCCHITERKGRMLG